ncbi:rhodanese-like domain-containing protein [Pseudodesulfovibrio sp. F-1]|uniref:Rhodanese-like domain-containing protein n=1 Tax=Pseudodesulfovibrio alkaliphilus TaxID=2661613 RepID=A0A7K1KN20_9BACT|nr:rhodanese-like domain-containing protein [Pseudodesulfovibrio alkaliphilus]MUM77486.1 rhodanese-like domain-containing protein [Pseudodesulfovibrio alkaliphilus]
MRKLWIAIILVGGFLLWDVGWWLGFGVSPMSPRELKLAVNEGRAPVIIDVRTRSEFESFHIPGAINVPYPAPLAELASVSPDPTRAVVVVCLTGHRSPPVAEQLHQGGYTAVTNLTWGMLAWKLFGGETASGP